MNDPPGERGCVEVQAPARLHLGFMDLNGDLGRRYGSVGLTLEGVDTRVRVTPSDEFSARGPGAERALGYARRLSEALQLHAAVEIDIDRAIPEHAGLGAGTQLALAVGTGIARCFDLETDTQTLARLLGRGSRSGIGVGAFEQGGFLIDGGRSGDTPPPVTVRQAFPAHWSLVLVFDASHQGLYGAREANAFNALPAFPPERAGHLCRLVMMQILPALVETDLSGFARGIAELQRIVGDHFALAQGGRFNSPAVSAALAWLERQGAAGVGQSSWGPTGFALMGDRTQAQNLVAEARRRSASDSRARFHLVGARNRGARVTPSDSARWGWRLEGASEH